MRWRVNGIVGSSHEIRLPNSCSHEQVDCNAGAGVAGHLTPKGTGLLLIEEVVRGNTIDSQTFADH
jgi:hypothetical protein